MSATLGDRRVLEGREVSEAPSHELAPGVAPQPEVVSLFSGIGGLDKGLLDAGFRIRSHAEIVPFRRRVLEERFPGVPCYEDVKEVPNADGAAVLCGGFPCQDLSVAGRRAGLRGDRSSLFWEFVRVVSASAVRPRFILLENVPGLLSSCSCHGCRKCGVLLRWHRRRGCQGSPGCPQCSAAERIRKRHAGTDAALVFAALANLGYRVSYRVLDSRHFGVPQRRRRVFVLAERDPGGEGAPEVLLEPEGGEGDPLAVGQPWPGPSGAPAPSAERSGVEGFGGGGEADVDIASTLGRFGDTGGHRQDFDSAGAYVVEPSPVDGHDRAGGGEPGEPAYPVSRVPGGVVVEPPEEANTLKGQRGKDGGGVGPEETLVPGRQFAPDEAATLTRGSSSDGVSEPGRRQEDDLNLVAEEHYYVDGHEDGTLRANGGADSKGHAGNRSDKQPMVVAAETGPGHWVEGDEAATLAERDWRSPSTVVGDQEIEGPVGSFLAGSGEKARGVGFEEEVAPTLGSESNGNQRTPTVVYTKGHSAHDAETDAENWNEAEVSRTLDGMGHAPTLIVEDAEHAAGGDETPPLTANSGSHGHRPVDNEAPQVIVAPVEEGEVANTLKAQDGRGWSYDPEATYVVEDSEIGGGRDPEPAGTSEPAGEADPGAGAAPEAIGFNTLQDPVSEEGVAPAFGKGTAGGYSGVGVVTEGERTADEDEPLALAWQQGDDSKATGTGRGRSWVARAGDYSGALSKQRHDAVQYRDVVRRLTPTECERLQALPDGWTRLDDSTPDGPRYAALGDAVTSATAWWIGRRILAKLAWLDGE